MFKVHFIKDVEGCDEDEGRYTVRLCHDVALPFPPYKGLYVSESTDEDDGWGDSITFVSWRINENQFAAYTEDDDEIYDAHMQGKGHRDTNEIVQEYLDKGWEVEDDGLDDVCKECREAEARANLNA